MYVSLFKLISHRQVYGLKKLASTLYNIPATSAMLQKHRNTLLNRQKIRATSADPRFRRFLFPFVFVRFSY